MHSSLPHVTRGHFTRGAAALFVVFGSMLLAGCSIWPKALSFSSDPEPVIEQAVPEPAVAAQPEPAPAPTEIPPPAPRPAAATPVAMSPMPPVSPPPAAAPEIVFPAHTSAKASAAPAAALVHGYYVNVGLFSVAANGANAYSKLDAAGLPVFSDGVQGKSGALTRVRVGPYSTRAQADIAAKKIRALKLDAVVFRN
jgi:cell division septation protein DedD